MNCETNNTADVAGERQSRPGYAPFLVRAFWIVFGATLLIFILFFSQGFIKLSETGRRLVAIFVFCACIALPSMILATWLSVRYSKRLPRLIALLQAVCFVFTASAGSLVAEFILWIVGICPHNAFWMQYRVDLPFGIVVTLAIGMSVTTYETMSYKLQAATLEARTRQVEQERAYKLLAEARLSSLESSIHPHFLFNTLNSIAALIPTNPQRAEAMVGKLASLLRFSLNAQHNGLVPLTQELKIVRDYLEIESTRYGPRLRYEILVPDPLDAVKIPPLALQTIVENSVKHVAARRSEGVAIQIVAAMEDGRIRLQVIDDGPGFSISAITPEHGLGNLIARLELSFGGREQFEVTRKAGKTVVAMTFPAET